MDPLTLALVGGSLGLNILGMGQSHSNAQMNYLLQREWFDYQKHLQKDIFAREDTAVQRRTADLKAAGINPMLAAGQGAGAGAAVATNAPQIPNSAAEAKMKAAHDMINVMTAHNQSEHIKMQNLLIEEEIENKKQITEGHRLDNKAFEERLEREKGLHNATISNINSEINRRGFQNERDLSETSRQREGYGSGNNSAAILGRVLGRSLKPEEINELIDLEEAAIAHRKPDETFAMAVARLAQERGFNWRIVTALRNNVIRQTPASDAALMEAQANESWKREQERRSKVYGGYDERRQKAAGGW